MEMYGYKFKNTNEENDFDKFHWLVELHHYKINGYLESEFNRHCDDDGP